MLPITWLALALSLPLAASSAIAGTSDNLARENASITQSLFTKRDDEFSVSLNFVKKWAAIGDSFTAGIGSGKRTGFPAHGTRNWMCSRYTYTWPNIVNRRIGGGVADFQYPACSGARTGDIYEQAQDLSGNLDVVMMTAGGNDLCLASMIKTCVLLPYDGESACTSLIEKAQENIETILKGNLRDILDALKAKVKSSGIVIVSGYAPFFNTESGDCGNEGKQKWSMPSYKSWRYWLQQGLTLTVDRRKKFNTLVANINKAIEEVVVEYQKDRDVKYDVEYSDWSGWPSEIDGEMCSPSSDGSYPDPDQPEMLFFKPNTWVRPYGDRDSLRRRRLRGAERRALMEDLLSSEVSYGEAAVGEENVDIEALEAEVAAAENVDIYDTVLFKSPNPRAVARRALDRRAPEPPGCPGDDSWDPVAKIGVPDFLGRNFHPNAKGHEAIAAFSLFNLAYAKTKQDGDTDQQCAADTSKFTCWQKSKDSKRFASWERLDENYRDYCAGVRAPGNTINWEDKKTYHSGTPEEVEFRVKLSNGASEFDEGDCREAMSRIINSCDGDDPNNPMNWKFGGEWQRGSYTYQIKPKRERTLHKRTDGRCKSWWMLGASSYQIQGNGWAGWDHGQQTLLKAARNCNTGLTSWRFKYYEDPDDNDGYEWKAEFDTVVFTGNRCFNNLKVQKGAGGYTHKGKKNIDKEKYEDFGCSGGG